MEFENVLNKVDLTSTEPLEYADKAWKQNKIIRYDYEDDYDYFVEAVTTGIVRLTRIDDREFIRLVIDFVGDPLNSVRGYVLTEQGSMYMFHGYGYDWISNDLLGGTADGMMRKAFDKFLQAKGHFWYGS